MRANAFMEFNWQLREWLTQLTFAQNGPVVDEPNIPLKNNRANEDKFKEHQNTSHDDSDILGQSLGESVAIR